jgi:Zn-dependent peptidase ImmA (M78 family)
MTSLDPAKIALSLRATEGIGDDPVDIFAFLQSREDVFTVRRFGESASIDGIYVKDAQSDIGFIYLNRAKPLRRQRFTAAHEFGHHLLGHHDELDADVFADSQNDEERAANRFAAEFLIPRPGLIKFISQHGLDVTRLADTIQVANHFGVTLQPVLIQLRTIDRLSGLDYRRLLREFEALEVNPLSEWENVDAAKKTDLPDHFVEHVRRRYLKGEVTAEGASEALDAPVEVILERFGKPTAERGPSDLSDLL